MYILLLIALWLIAARAGGSQSPKNAPQREFSSQQYIIAHNSVLNDLRALEKAKLRSMIISKAIKNNIDPDLFLRIAICESGLQKNSQNKNSTASGIFQFLNSTFIKQAKAYGLRSTDKNNPEIQAELAALMISDGGIHNWSASRSCWD